MDIDLQLFKNIMAESRHNSDLLDSYSPNQFRAKEKLVNMIYNHIDINSDSEIVILGGWYGSILIPAFKEVKRITLIDLDKEVVSIAKNRLFNHYKNVDFITSDVFHNDRKGRIQNANLIINTSCEHMTSMKKLELDTNAYFAFTSNNMYDIEGHTNCVNDIEQFKKQLPVTSKVLAEDEITDERGTRFLLVGKI
jgi:hypothetical protein|tara:strand:+ start:726 stop:1310 length:585 start_codon:yes stop_codon:yes gene_type:complete